MLSSAVHQKITFFALALISFSLPLHPRFNSLPLILLGLNWLLEGRFKEKFQVLFYKRKAALLLIGLYLLYAVGLLWSNDWQEGLIEIQVKLTLLLFPLLICSLPYLSRYEVRRLFKAFVIGCFLACLICLGNAMYNYWYNVRDIYWTSNYFTYKQYSVILQANYFSFYLILGIIILFFDLIKKGAQRNGFWIGGEIFLIILFSINIFQLSARAAILYWGVVIIFSLIVLIVKKRRIGIGLIGLVVFSFIFYESFEYFPKLQYRMSKVQEELEQLYYAEDYKVDNARIAIWKAVIPHLDQNPWFGVGTGDVKQALQNAYRKSNRKFLLQNQYNAHNQFLQTAVPLGVMGLIILLGTLLIPFILSIKQGQVEFLLFLGAIVVFFMVESVLERQMGVVFFALFYSLFLYCPFKSVNSKVE